jgi:hypothetical protein
MGSAVDGVMRPRHPDTHTTDRYFSRLIRRRFLTHLAHAFKP